MKNPTLPDEILVEIISRIPPKFVGKCKCLSKFWLSFLSKSEFTNLYLTNHENLILITPSHSLHLVLVTPTLDKNKAISQKLDLPGSWTQVIGSCNGLVLLTNKECELYLVNPVTCSMVKIHDFDLALEKNVSTRTHGFGYDDSTNDYKIVTISFYYVSGGSFSGHEKTFVDVYSVKMGVWKRVDFAYNGFVTEIDPNASEVFVNGAMHWQIFSTNTRASRLIAFELGTEVFYEIRASFICISMWWKLVVRGGRLSVVTSVSQIGSRVWTMEEYGSAESWRKFRIVGNDEWGEVRPLWFVGEDILMLTTAKGRLVVYDEKETVMKDFVVDGVPDCCKGRRRLC